jgi:hypothetical protein
MLAPMILVLTLLLGGYTPSPGPSSSATSTVTPYDVGSGGPAKP